MSRFNNFVIYILYFLFNLPQLTCSTPLPPINKPNSINPNSTNTFLINKLTKLATSTIFLQDKRLNEIRTKLQENSQKQRHKRELAKPNDGNFLKEVVSYGTLEVPSVIVDVAYIKTSKKIFLVGAGRSDGSLALNPVWYWDYLERNFEILTNIQNDGSVDVEGFTINDEAYFIFAVNVKDNLLDYIKRGTKLYKITSDDRITEVQTFPTTGTTQWKYFFSHGNHYLVQSSLVQWQRRPTLYEDYAHSIIAKGSKQVLIYKWNGFAFSIAHTLPASHSTKVDITYIAGRTLMAVVNQSFSESSVTSTVLIYELYPSSKSVGHVKLIQRISGWAVSDVHFVQVDRSNFLAIAYEFRVHNGQMVTKVDSVIFRFNGFFFDKYQTISTSCALKWTTLSRSNDNAALYLLSAEEETVLELIDGTWIKVPLSLLASIQFDFAGPIGISTFDHESKSLVALVTPGKVRLLELEFIKALPISEDNEIMNKCQQVLEKANQLTLNRQKYGASEERAASLTAYQTITGVKHFKDVEIQNLHLANLTTKQTNVYQHVLVNRFRQTIALLDKYPVNFDGYLKKSIVQQLPGNLAVNNIWVDRLQTTNVEFNLVNDVPFCNYLSRVMTFDQITKRHIEIHSAKFEKLVFEDNINIRGTINSIKIPDGLVFLDKPNTFTGRKVFEHEIFVNGSLKVKNTLNNIRPEHILLTHGHQIIHTETTIIGDIRVVNVDVSLKKRVSGVDWNWLVNETVRIDRSMVIRGDKRFLSNVQILGDFRPQGLVSGVNVHRLLTDAVPLSRPTRFLSSVTFNDVFFRGNVRLGGKMNNLNVPSDLVLVTTPKWEVNLVSSLSLHLRHLEVKGLLNGLRIDKKHVMTRYGTQVIRGVKKFHVIHVQPSLTITGLVNDINLNQLVEKIESQVITADTYYPKLTVHNLEVDGQIPEALNKLFYQSIHLHEDVTFKGHVTFEQTTIFENNLELPPIVFEHLVPIKSPTTIHLTTRILDDVVFEDNIQVEGLINNIDLVEFTKDIFLVTGNQTIQSPKTFSNSIQLGKDVRVGGTINTVDLRHVVKINEDIKIKGKVGFHVPPSIHGFSEFESTIVESSLNSKNVMNWFEDTLLVDTPQSISGPKKFFSSVNVGKKKEYRNLQIDGKVFLNGVVLSDFVEDVVLVDQVNVLLYDTTFSSRLKIRDLQTVVIDDVNVVDLFQNSLHTEEKRCLTVKSDINIQHLHTNFINNIDLTKFFKDVVFLNDTNLPSLNFHQVIAPEVQVDGLVNGLKFPLDVIKISSREMVEVTGSKKFHNGLSLGKVKMEGKINGIDLIEIYKRAVKQEVRQTISGVLHVDELNVKGNVTIQNLVGEIDLASFLNDAWLVDQSTIIYGEIEFFAFLFNPISTNSMKIDGLLDGIDVKHVFDDVVTVNNFQVITGMFVFKNHVTFRNIILPNITCTEPNCLVNQKNLVEWNRLIMKKNTVNYINAPKTFANSTIFENILTVEGRVNDISTEQMMKVRGKQRIFGTKVFDHMTVVTLLTKGSLMGVDVTTWERNSVFVDQPVQEVVPLVIREYNEFTSLVFDSDVVFEKGIDGIDTSNLVTVHGTQEITGRKVFKEEIVTPSWTKAMHILGRLNDVREPFPDVLQHLFDYPLPYPCPTSYVYYQKGCYQVIVQPNIQCTIDASNLQVFTEMEKELLMTMKLEERLNSWFIRNTNFKVKICRIDALLLVEEPTTLTGTFTFNLDMTTMSDHDEIWTKQLLSPLFHQLTIDTENFLTVKLQIESATNELQEQRYCVCSSLMEFEDALDNAYKPLGSLNVIQTLDIEPLKVLLLNQQLLGGPLSFIAVEKDAITLYQWIQEKFIKSFVLNMPPINHTVNVEINHEVKSEVISIILFNSIGCTNKNKLDEIKILYLGVNTLIPNLKFLQYLPNTYQLNCNFKSNVRPVLLMDDLHLIYGQDNSVTIFKWNNPHQTIDFTLKNAEVTHIYPFDSHGQVAVASQYNGVNFFTVYKIDVVNKIIHTLSNLYNIPRFRKIIAATIYDFIILTKSQLHLIHYDTSLNLFSTKQVINIDCPIDLYWLRGYDFNWLIVSSCTSSYFYSFDGYLHKVHEVDEIVVENPQVVDQGEEIIVIIPVKSDFEKKVKILRGKRKGPQFPSECPRKC